MSLRDQLFQAGLSTQALASMAERQQEDLAVFEEQERPKDTEEPRQTYLSPLSDIDGHAQQLQRASSHHRALVGDDLLRMNSRFGNRYVNRVLKAARSAGRQTERATLSVGAPDDRYEREAERIAARQTGEVGMPEAFSPDNSASARSESRDDAARGDGMLLPDPLRQSMEEAFGVDLRRVRVHSDAASARLNEHLQSRAFTAGQDIFMAAGAFSPQTADGRALLAHEVAHVVQQSGSAVERAQTGLSAAPPGVIQRLLQGTAKMLRREGGAPSAEEAAPKGFLGFFGFGKSLYAKILDALDDYEDVEWRYEHGEARRKGSFYLDKLTDLIKLIDQWLEKPDQQSEGPPSARAVAKREAALRQVKDIVQQEIEVVRRHGAPDTRYTRIRGRRFKVDPLEQAPRRK